MTPAVEAELRLHELSFPLHDDFDHSLCSCRKVIVARPAPLAQGLQDGGVCFACGGLTVRTGTCTTCTSCGETGGCG